MRTNYTEIRHPQFKILSEDQIKDLHYATLELLESTGIKVNNQEAIELLDGAGAHIDDNNTVKIPSFLVEEAIRTAPSRVVVSDREGNRKIQLEEYRSYFGGESSNINIMDLETGNPRACKREDVRRLAILHDYLPRMDFMMMLGQLSDVAEKARKRVEFKEILLNSTCTPLVGSDPSLKDVDSILEMAALVAGSYKNLEENPFVIFYNEPISPLIHDHGLTIALKVAEYGLPIVYTPMPIGGATAPLTFAGNLVLNNAECLSGLTIIQLKKKGAKTIYGGIPSPMDMRTMIYPYGAPELSLLCSAMAEMGKFYGLPVYGTAGCGDSKSLDSQTGVEFSFSSIFQCLSGANLIHDVGLIDHANICSLEAHLLMDEIIGMLEHVMQGIEINDITLALDTIAEVGPGGNFVDTENTYENFKNIWQPRWFDKSFYEKWKAAGEVTLKERLNQEVKEIISNHQPKKLSADKIKELDRMEESWLKE